MQDDEFEDDQSETFTDDTADPFLRFDLGVRVLRWTAGVAIALWTIAICLAAWTGWEASDLNEGNLYAGALGGTDSTDLVERLRVVFTAIVAQTWPYLLVFIAAYTAMLLLDMRLEDLRRNTPGADELD